MTIDVNEPTPKPKQPLMGMGSESFNNENYYRCFQNYYHGHNFLKPNPQYITNVDISIEHWQLRNLLQAKGSNGLIYYTHGDSIRGLELSPGSKLKSRNLISLEYSPKCFHHDKYGNLVAGGLIGLSSSDEVLKSAYLGSPKSQGSMHGVPKGLFSFANPTIGVSKTYRLGEAINNAVELNKLASSNLKAYVCNNDSNLYEVEIGNSDIIRQTNSIVCELNIPLNNVCSSPSNNKIITVTGDSPSIYLLDLVSNRSINTIRTKNDSGFGISYHDNGNLFATTFQNGICSLFDIRNMKEHVVEIKSSRPGQGSGAFRCCKFSNISANDLLVISEHVGRVHIIDLRNLSNGIDESHQVIVFPLALDQFSDYQIQKNHTLDNVLEDEVDVSQEKGKGEFHRVQKVQRHEKLSIYEDLDSYSMLPSSQHNSLSFTAPLVYDCDYLSTTNPKLFKNFTYQPRGDLEETSVYCPPPEYNYPMWRTNYLHSEDNNDQQYGRYSAGPDNFPASSGNPSGSVASGENEAALTDDKPDSYYTRLYQDAYSSYSSHINGEMEIAGIDWDDRELYIGCEKGGIIKWPINQIGRRSFGSFSYA